MLKNIGSVSNNIKHAIVKIQCSIYQNRLLLLRKEKCAVEQTSHL